MCQMSLHSMRIERVQTNFEDKNRKMIDEGKNGTGNFWEVFRTN